MNQFEKLVSELQGLESTVAKALPASGEDDATIRAAAGEGDAGGSGDGDADDGSKKPGEGDGDTDDAGKAPMAKSLKLVDADGKHIEVEDATLVLKALGERIDGMGSNVESALAATLGAAKKLGEVVVSQGVMLKSLSEQVAKLSGQGGGRKAVVSLVPKGSAADVIAKGGAGDGATPAGQTGEKITMDANEFMAKALSAQKAGVITGLDVCLAEAKINRGEAPPENISKAVLKHAAKADA